MLFKWVACKQFQKQFNFYLKSFFSEIGLFLRWCDDLWYHLISDTTSLMHLRETISNINVHSYQGNKFFEHKTFPIWLFIFFNQAIGLHDVLPNNFGMSLYETFTFKVFCDFFKRFQWNIFSKKDSAVLFILQINKIKRVGKTLIRRLSH